MVCFDNDRSDSKPIALQTVYDLSEANVTINIKNAPEVKAQQMIFRVYGIDEDDVFPLYLDHINPQPGPDPDPSKNLVPKCKLQKDYLGIENNLFPLYRNMILHMNEVFIIDLNEIYNALNVTYTNLPINRSNLGFGEAVFIDDAFIDFNIIPVEERFVWMMGFDMEPNYF